jgi:hypothetical protein
MGAKTSSFLAGAAGGFVTSLALNAPRGTGAKIWNILCLVFLPMWAAFMAFACANAFEMQGGMALFNIFVTVGLFTLLTGIASVKLFSGGTKLFRTFRLWWGTFSALAIPGKVLMLLPFGLLLGAAIAPAAGSVGTASLLGLATAIYTICVGAFVGKQERARLAEEDRFVANILHSIEAVFGATFEDGSVTWGAEPGSVVISPIPFGTSRNLNQLSELHARCAEFAPEFLISELTSTRVTFLPVTTLVSA